MGIFNSLAFDPLSSNPVISYNDDTNEDLKFARFNGSSWDITTVDSAGDVGEFASLAFDPLLSNPAISYYDRTNGDLKFAQFNGIAWDITTVDSAGDVGRDASLTFDLSGNPAISYFNGTNAIKFARFVPVTTSTTTTTTTTTSTTTTTFVCQCPTDSPEGCISGVVIYAPNRLPHAGMTITLKRVSPRPGVKTEAVTDSDGCYRFTELEDGRYEIKVKRCIGGKKKIIVIRGGAKVNDVDFRCK